MGLGPGEPSVNGHYHYGYRCRDEGGAYSMQTSGASVDSGSMSKHRLISSSQAGVNGPGRAGKHQTLPTSFKSPVSLNRPQRGLGWSDI